MMALALTAGCQVKENKDAAGDTKSVEVAPAAVEVGTDTATVTVPTVDIKPTDTTTTR